MENTEKPIDKFIGKKFKVKGCDTVFNIANINEQNKITVEWQQSIQYTKDEALKYFSNGSWELVENL